MKRVVVHYVYRVDPLKTVFRAVFYKRTVDEVLRDWYNKPACYDYRNITSVCVEEV